MTFSNQSKFQKASATKGWQWFPAVPDNLEASPLLRGGSDDNPAQNWFYLVKWLWYETDVMKSLDRGYPFSFSWACLPPCHSLKTQSSWLKPDLIAPPATSWISSFLHTIIFALSVPSTVGGSSLFLFPGDEDDRMSGQEGSVVVWKFSEQPLWPGILLPSPVNILKFLN